ncbi:MAG: response regulator [Cyanobacteria bacterium J06634_5]
MVTRTLGQAGYQVEQAKDDQEAADKLLNGLWVDAILCDVEMPRLDGYGFLSKIKAYPKFEAIPVVMLTSRAGNKHRETAYQLGALAYLTKPYDDNTLLRTLDQLIHQSG